MLLNFNDEVSLSLVSQLENTNVMVLAFAAGAKRANTFWILQVLG